MLSTAQQMLQDSRTKIELLRMQIVKVSQARDDERDGTHGKQQQVSQCVDSVLPLDITHDPLLPDPEELLHQVFRTLHVSQFPAERWR